jgi:hypothetical protein
MAIIGKNTIGVIFSARVGSSRAHNGAIYQYTAVPGDVVTMMYAYGTVGAGDPFLVALYDVIAGVPTNQVGGVNTLCSAGPGPRWHSCVVNIPLVNGTLYTIAVATQLGSVISEENTGLANMRGSADHPPPDPWTTAGFSDWLDSVYAETGAAPPPVSKIIYPCRAQLIT